jgi:hypothetical protein
MQFQVMLLGCVTKRFVHTDNRQPPQDIPGFIDIDL